MQTFLMQIICTLQLFEYAYGSLPIEANCDGTSTCTTASLCQEGWTYRFRRCYKTVSTGASYQGAVKLLTAPWSYNEAQSMCNIEKGYLPVITNSDEESFLSTAGGQNKWIGFNDRLVEGTFMWDDEYKKSTTYTNWNSGEPNNGGGEDCAVARVSSKWNDLGCEHAKLAVCEMDLTPRLWYPRGTSMYLFNTVEQTWIYARDSCEDVGAHLVVIGDDSEYEFVRITVGTGTHAWIGLNDYESEGNYVWPDSGEMSDFVPQNKYYPGEPNDGAGTGTQDAIYIGCNTNYMDDGDISTTMQSVCEKGIEWEYYNGKRYFATDYRLSASDAIDHCNDIGGNLAVITSNEENMFLFNMIKKSHYLKHDFYIGLVSDSNGIWSWRDSSEVVYSNWKEGRDTLASGCAVLSLKDAQWRDKDCAASLGFICEDKIPWIPWHDEKYYINTTPMPYDKAREVCQKLGGDLVSYDTIEEQRVVTQGIMQGTSIINTKYKHVYIGNRKEGYVFKWTRSDSVYSLQNWCSGEPSGGNEECTEFLSDRTCYNDIECSKYRASVCEVDLHPNDGELWEQRRYLLYSRNTQSYQSASSKCKALGMELATISSQYEHEVAIALVESLGYGSSSIYIGYDDIDTEGKYVWKTASSRAQTNGFESWSESSTFNDGYDCTVLRPSMRDWYSVPCSNTYYFLCELDAEEDSIFIGNGVNNSESTCVQGHVIKDVHVRSLVECLKTCIDEPLCLSINFYSNTINDVRNCQLNDSLKSNYPEDMFEIETCRYYEFK